ncbi:lysophospholipase-like protein 1 isoform X2 [Planococcus citri]|uniref:lysophospholipase-like protein 1 isoform X2 n=1 Tax=Planococcus citri TaxID=170843 RepID=UPI0031F97903
MEVSPQILFTTKLFTLLTSFCHCNVPESPAKYSNTTIETSTPPLSRVYMDPDSIIYPTRNHTATVIFLHPLGEVGTTAMDLLKYEKEDFEFANIKILFPTAPCRPYTPLGGDMRYIWFDVTEESYRSKELLTSFEHSYEDLRDLILKEVEAGIPLNKIAIGGYLEGGTMALHMAFRIVPEIAGVFALTSYLHRNTVVLKELREKPPPKLPILLWTHGTCDASFVHAKDVFEDLMELGVPGQFFEQPNIVGKLNPGQLEILHGWLSGVLEVD